VTDIATRDGDTASNAVVGAPAGATVPLLAPPPAPPTATPAFEWAQPPAPVKRKRHLGWWIGGGVAVVAIAGLVVSSLVLIAPGTSIGAVPVGFLTPGGATDAVNARLASTTLEIRTPGEALSMTGAELGAHVDASALATDAFAQHPMWNLGSWFAPAAVAAVTIDRDVAAAALAKAAPGVYTAPVDAKIAFDPASASYAVTPAVPGTGIDLDAVQASLGTAFATGQDAAFTADVIPVTAAFTTDAAQQFAGTLNSMLDTAGFYVGDERTVPIDRATLASWLTLSVVHGQPSVAVNKTAVAAFVQTLPGLVNRAPVNATVVVNDSGDHLRDLVAGLTGRTLDSTSGIADAYATQLAAGQGVYKLTVAETPFQTTTLDRLLEVDLSAQRLYLKENGAVVDSWLISSGRPATPTDTGHYRINSHIEEQTMTGLNPDGSTYVQPDVKWVMYFNGDQGFHGVYWHDNWGQTMSHGCVGMPEDLAKKIYDWAPTGVDVWIHT
jgi:lipoprotein-anchoring transpeptidase ErfK/SrfK